MYILEKKIYSQDTTSGMELYLGADIGGTNANFGIFCLTNDTFHLLESVHIKSQTIDNFTKAVQQVLEYVEQKYKTQITKSCFGVAGVIDVESKTVKPTNLSITLDAHDIKKNTTLSCVFLVNDFQLIGYGIDLIDPRDVVQIKEGISKSQANKAILGAGTGMGKCIMFYDVLNKSYDPVPSEGGHADMAAQNTQEIELINFIQKKEGWGCNVSWEDVLSGEGIKRLYYFFAHKNGSTLLFGDNGPHPDQIFKQRNENKNCWDTYQLYGLLYARCAKNFALDALGTGGVYIAGGIAAHNIPLFKEESFKNEFVNCGKQQAVLNDIPIYVIADYNVSLYGAAAYLRIKNVC